MTFAEELCYCNNMRENSVQWTVWGERKGSEGKELIPIKPYNGKLGKKTNNNTLYGIQQSIAFNK